MLILVDQDGVLADFDGAWARKFALAHPDAPVVDVTARSMFKITGAYDPAWHERIMSIYTAPGFFAGLPVVPGAVEGVRALAEAGHDVFICTSPLTEYQHCVAEKFEWVEATFGSEWISRIVLAKDKTLVRGDLLVDDKPHVTGVLTPIWKHVRYTRSYNEAVAGVPRLTWATASPVIAALGAALAA